MDTQRALPGMRWNPFRWLRGGGLRLSGRMAHVVWSTLIAAALVLLNPLDPLDQFNWLIQSKLGVHKPSGDIVFVGASENLDDPRLGHRRIELASALDELERRGVGKVYLDIAFDEPSRPQYDERLARAIADLGPRIVVADQLELDSKGNELIRRTLPQITGSASRVVSDKLDRNYFGIKWVGSYRLDDGGQSLPTLEAALGGYANHAPGKFQIDYGFKVGDAPALSIEALSQRDAKPIDAIDLAGKSVVIGYTGQVASSKLIIPNNIGATPSFIPIFAGETLRSGRTGYIGGGTTVALIAALLAILILLNTSLKRRWIGYGLISLSIPVALVATARLGIRVEAANAMALLVVFALFRSRTRWKQWVALVNQETGIPTLRALEARLTRESIGAGHIVIAKLHNYDRVRKTLHPDDRSSYIVKVIDRLRASDPSLAVYSDGHHLGWYTATDNTAALMEHLEGMRAIFAAPVVVGTHSVDVDITFGLAAVEGDPQGRIVAAVAAAEETSEAHEPIKAAESGNQTDLLWDISLRARIDEAMEMGEIYCVYQPKIEAATGRMVGVEALVRWHDPARGFIQPLHFIKQCEKAGRMEHLTRYVLQSACSAGKLLHFRGRPIHMSVNISATLLSDMRIVGNVRNVLQATQFDPHYLILEITETSRIADLATASTILNELRALGVKISVDDFGVGAANFETFYELPFDELKIDRLFVANLARDAKARAIVSSIVVMGKSARITIVAEGVENAEDVQILTEIGCELLQGYYFSRPISLSNLLDFKDIAESDRAAKMV
jgi:EAL domain-containing protein (putative c-di-GMP-specific phosphodiesterase class I)